VNQRLRATKPADHKPGTLREFTVVFEHTLSLSGGVVIMAEDEDDAEAKAEKMAGDFAGVYQWEMHDFDLTDTKSGEIEWEEDDNSTSVESVTED
jgi:alkanesulfonate monooxygenase SsuD/methylene tetrahydromethanopterin reductase-like flavin-dependent oxidoreductase (luciferase family)